MPVTLLWSRMLLLSIFRQYGVAAFSHSLSAQINENIVRHAITGPFVFSSNPRSTEPTLRAWRIILHPIETVTSGISLASSPAVVYGRGDVRVAAEHLSIR
jgi:hypothetical protein